jgi:hypothetical protein
MSNLKRNYSKTWKCIKGCGDQFTTNKIYKDTPSIGFNSPTLYDDTGTARFAPDHPAHGYHEDFIEIKFTRYYEQIHI